MKIEKLSDDQIRCTLNAQDLTSRQLKINELAYGSDKAKKLFQEMLKQASEECGFDTQDMPLMIEAIPISSERLVLVITRIDEPENLDFRFSNFTETEETPEVKPKDVPKLYANELLNDAKLINESIVSGRAETNGSDSTMNENTQKNKAGKSGTTVKPPQEVLSEILAKGLGANIKLSRVFRFKDITEVSDFAKQAQRNETLASALFKDNVKECYYLLLQMPIKEASYFNKVCNIAGEYGEAIPSSPVRINFIKEQCTQLISVGAIETLSKAF